MELSRRARSLRSVITGRVGSLGELCGIPPSQRSGYYVHPRRRSAAERRLAAWLGRNAPRLAQRVFPRETAVYPPADGVVTASGSGILTLRTGDGVYLTVVLPPAAELPEAGSRLRTGEPVCSLPVQLLEENGAAVFFPEPSQITELHVFGGRRSAAHRTAFFRLRAR